MFTLRKICWRGLCLLSLLWKFCGIKTVDTEKMRKIKRLESTVMGNWNSFLPSDLTLWLLEEENPSVRYLTLTQVLGKSMDDREVLRARKNVMSTGIVPSILAKQKQGGYWEKLEDFYMRTKYKGTIWQLIIMAELETDGRDPRVRRAVEFILTISQDRQSGGFSYDGSLKNGGHHSKVLPCLTGNMVWSMIKLGYLDDPRVQQGIDWITTYQRFDDGIPVAPKGWPYEKLEQCWGRHTCSAGVVKTLKALAEIPPKKRTREVKACIEEGAEFLLRHHVFKRSHDLRRTAKPKWLKLAFPTMWDTDVLEILLILTGLGYRDKRMLDAVGLLISKQDEDSRWNLEQTYNGRFQANIEQKGKSSKWITFRAVRVMKNFLSAQNTGE